MYNADKKSAFLSGFQDSESITKLIKNIFILLERFESEYGKDFSQFDREELQASVPSVAGIRYESAEVVLSYLKKYTKWSAAQGDTIDESIFSFDIDTSGKVRSCFVRSPEHLLYVLNYVFKNTQDNSIEYIYRTYLWLAYFGFTEKEAACVMADDVSFDKMCIWYGQDKSLSRQIYEESVQDLRMASMLDCFTEIKRKVAIDRARGRELLRGKPSAKTVEESLATTFRQTVSKYFANAVKELDRETYKHPDLSSINLSFKRVYLSGMFYRAYQREKLGDSIDFDVVVAERYEKSKHEYRHDENAANKMKYHMKRGYLEDYESWKRAFEL